MPKMIPLTHGYHTVVDETDYEWLMQWKWYTWRGNQRTFYAQRERTLAEGRPGTTVRMHRRILNLEDAPRAIMIDHRDGNGLNNQRVNLRICNMRQNQRNRIGAHRGSASQFKGVWLNQKGNRWVAGIRVEGKLIYLGTFLCERDAALAYDAAARTHFGAFAHLNCRASS